MRSTVRHRGAAAIAVVAAFALVVVAGEAMAAARIGVAAAVKNDVKGFDGGAARALQPGSELFALETVKTGDASAAQLIFLDETSLSIGPRAEIKLDRFVFDPDRTSGDVLLSASRGAFRFISGSQNPNSYKVRTPVATIGFRGTIVDCLITAAGLICILQEGQAYLEVGGVVYHLKKAGQALFVTAAGEVQGPFTPDGVFFEVAGIFPFPLFGGDFDAVIKHLDIGDDVVDLIDELNAQNADPYVPPPPPSPPPPPPPPHDCTPNDCR